MTVLATAGHVDHGKSTLVEFLTGQETDRLEEEKQRGLTINLGYTYFEHEERIFSIVDVPGHSDYFKNTISGFSNVDGVLFCIDTTQGWSQQSEEHFVSLINLGIKNILFFLTKVDKPEVLIDRESLKNKLQNHSDLNYEIVEFSSLNSDKSNIKKAIHDFFNNADISDNPASIWIDRVFSIDGIGQVITGTASKAMDFENVYFNDQQTKLDIREVQSIGRKVTSSHPFTSRVAISLKKSNKIIPKKGSLLTNQISYPSNYIFIKPNTKSENFDDRGTIRIYVGTHSQIIKKYRTLKINKQVVCVVQLEKSISSPNFQKVLLHNLSKNTFIGGEIIFGTENGNLIKKLIKNYKKYQNIDSNEFFTLIPEGFVTGNFDSEKVGNFYFTDEKLAELEGHVRSNIDKINKTGAIEYFFKNFFIKKSELDQLFKNFLSFKVSQNQILEDHELNINNEVLDEIILSLGSDLSVGSVDFKKFKNEDVKILFMNNYLFRISKNLVISRDHREELIKIINTLPDEFSITDFKNASNLSRKYTIPYLEFLDKESITKKINNEGKRRKLA